MPNSGRFCKRGRPLLSTSEKSRMSDDGDRISIKEEADTASFSNVYLRGLFNGASFSYLESACCRLVFEVETGDLT